MGNLKDYLSGGADAVALGGAVFSFDRMKNQRLKEIQKDVEEFMFAVHSFYSKIPK